jgi:hypothetical protein
MEDVSVEECYCVLLGNSTSMKALARNHITCDVRGFLQLMYQWAIISICLKYMQKPL